MDDEIAEAVFDFYERLYRATFLTPCQGELTAAVTRRRVANRLNDLTLAAARPLIRSFRRGRTAPATVGAILDGLGRWIEIADLETLATLTIEPVQHVEDLLKAVPCPPTLTNGAAADYRLAADVVARGAVRVAKVWIEYRRASFPDPFDPLKRLIDDYDALSDRFEGVTDDDDGEFEQEYRELLLQRHQIDVGTVRMTLKGTVDIRRLFVMPDVMPARSITSGGREEVAELLSLDRARELMGRQTARQARRHPALRMLADDQANRLVLIGPPGSGKSTFLDWLNLEVASGKCPVVLNGGQAIPVLLRVRRFETEALPTGDRLISVATDSTDLAERMPAGWVERMMAAGRMALLIDGLDEIAANHRDTQVLPWLIGLCRDYPACLFLLSSRPAGYPLGTLDQSGFTEYEVADFSPEQVKQYAINWRTALRLADNQGEAAARRDGTAEGERIVESFKDQGYIVDLARNPLMMSAICLVIYFSGKKLPDDRAELYKLCVEGLLHFWDEKRAIHSDYSLREKLDFAKHVALIMQRAGIAEIAAERLEQELAALFSDRNRTACLMEEIRHRAGLLIERRPGFFAFAHLTFQEYLTAVALDDGNCLDVNVKNIGGEIWERKWHEPLRLLVSLGRSSTIVELARIVFQEDPSDVFVEFTDELALLILEIQFDTIKFNKIDHFIALCRSLSAACGARFHQSRAIYNIMQNSDFSDEMLVSSLIDSRSWATYTVAFDYFLLANFDINLLNGVLMPAIDRSCTDERSQRVCARIFLLAIVSNDCTAIYKILDCFNRNDIVLDIDAFTDRYEKILRVSNFLHMLIELVCSGKANDKTLEKLFRYIELMDFRKFSLYPFAVEFPGVVKGMLLMLKNRITALIQDNGRAARVFHEMIKEKFDRKDFETMGERQEELIPLVEVLLGRLSTISDCGRDFGWSSSMSSSIAIEINRMEHEGK